MRVERRDRKAWLRHVWCLVGAVSLLAGAVGCSSRGAASPANRSSRHDVPASQAAPTSTTNTSTTSTTSTPTTRPAVPAPAQPTTTASTTPSTPASAPSSSPAAVHRPVHSIQIVGDSVGWSIGWALAPRAYLHPGVKMFLSGDRLGCGVVDDIARKAYPSAQVCDGEVGLFSSAAAQQRPDLVTIFTGVWEAGAITAPDGRHLAPGTAAHDQYVFAGWSALVAGIRRADPGVEVVAVTEPNGGAGTGGDFPAGQLTAGATLLRRWAAANAIPVWDMANDASPALLAQRKDGVHFDNDAGPALWQWFQAHMAAR